MGFLRINLLFFCFSLLACGAIAYILGKFWFGDIRNRKLLSIFVLGAGIFFWTLLSAISPIVHENYFIFVNYFRLTMLYSMSYLAIWFTLQLTKSRVLEKPWFLYSLFALLAINLGILLTNPLHHLLFTEFYFPGPPLSGPLIPVQIVVSNITNTFSILLLLHYVIKNAKKNPSLILAAIGMFIPFSIALLRHLYIVQIYVDFTPLSYCVTLFVFLYVAYRSRILNVNSPAMFLNEIRNAAYQLEAAKAQAEESSRAKSNFLARMSHEIRTPMNAIIGIAQIQMQNRDLPKEQAHALKKIYESGNGLLGIINDILDLSKVETGKMEINPVEYDVPSLIHDAVQLNIVRLAAKPLEFILDIDEELPLKLIGDELRLKQIINNLLSNAIKYTDKGKIQLRINSGDLADEENVLIRFIVSDTGQGMKSEDLEKLFSEYSRFNMETNRTIEGTGIGLNITKSLVELMGGTIRAESQYGSGSIFTVMVKQKLVDSEVIGPELSKQLGSFAFFGEKHYDNLQILHEAMPYGKVLIVDDVETNLYVAKGLMSPYGLQIDTAISGFQAIEKVQGGKTYDVIFMDHMMPKMDGIETVRIIREWEQELQMEPVPIIALTANALAGNLEMFLSKGFNGFISKPIDIAQLDETLKKWIRDKQTQETLLKAVTTNNEHLNEHFNGALQIEDIDGLDIKNGIKLVGGNEEVYIDMLAIFCGDVEERLPLLSSVPEAGTLETFITEVHAIKSAAKYIGAVNVSALAAELETAGEAGDFELIQDKLSSFVEQLTELTKNIKAALKN